MKNLLIVDDDIDMCLLLNNFLTRKGYRVNVAHTCADAIQHIAYSQPDLVICDVWLEDMDGITLLQKVKESFPDVPFIFITAYSDLKTSMNAIKFGALEYVTKPLLPEEIATIIQRALDKVSLNNKQTDSQLPVARVPDFYYGPTDLFTRLYKQINLIAPTDYSVNIHGESGTGKEGIAREIHLMSNRKSKPFVVFNCNSISGEPGEIELFGCDLQMEGVATVHKKGCLELANGGTLVLDEVACLSHNAQQMLIKAIKEKKMTRVGGGQEIELDVRLISASIENLWHAAHHGRLIEETYHLLNDFTIEVLPLRNRKEDLMLFAGHFLDIANAEHKTNFKGFDPEVEIIFKNHVWQDNLRELKNVISKAALLSKTDYIEASSLPHEICHFSKNTSVIPDLRFGVLN